MEPPEICRFALVAKNASFCNKRKNKQTYVKQKLEKRRLEKSIWFLKLMQYHYHIWVNAILVDPSIPEKFPNFSTILAILAAKLTTMTAPGYSLSCLLAFSSG